MCMQMGENSYSFTDPTQNEASPEISYIIYTVIYCLRKICPTLHLCSRLCCYLVCTQEAKYVERWPNTTSAWAGWSRFDIPVDRYDGVHSLLICTSITLGSSTCHQASQQENTYCTKYQKADRASTLVTLWCVP